MLHYNYRVKYILLGFFVIVDIDKYGIIVEWKKYVYVFNTFTNKDKNVGYGMHLSFCSVVQYSEHTGVTMYHLDISLINAHLTQLFSVGGLRVLCRVAVVAYSSDGKSHSALWVFLNF